MPVSKTQLIAVLANELWLSTLSPNVPWLSAELRERMKRPHVGDLVVEFSAGQRGDADGVGWLRGIEFADGRGGGSVNIDGQRVVDAWMIEPIDMPGQTIRWSNATFFAIPLQSARQWLSQKPAQ
ncbi:hypothetical protein [Plantactinospora sp. ZYX-F-223]|uniref:hypothetical protein n=1 Tax=Plantactinospora sp. ZYX-F-223 TaxID=3144103 RepID=UPI0031FDE152